MVQWKGTQLGTMRLWGSIPGIEQWVEDLALLWLWCRPVAMALIRSLAWEPPYAVGAALKKRQKKKNSIGTKLNKYNRVESPGTRPHIYNHCIFNKNEKA